MNFRVVLRVVQDYEFWIGKNCLFIHGVTCGSFVIATWFVCHLPSKNSLYVHQANWKHNICTFNHFRKHTTNSIFYKLSVVNSYNYYFKIVIYIKQNNAFTNSFTVSSRHMYVYVYVKQVKFSKGIYQTPKSSRLGNYCLINYNFFYNAANLVRILMTIEKYSILWLLY